jgi:hypothetical protein
MIAVADIRKELSRVIEDPGALDEFEDWLVAKSWNMHRDSDPIAQAMVSSIELRLAEHSDGHLPVDQMIEDFRSLLDGFVVVNVRLNADPSQNRSGSSISVESADRPLLAPSSEKGLLTVYA